MYDGSKYEILYCDKAGKYAPEQVGGIRTKVIVAGDTLEVESFPILKNVSAGAREEAKKRESSAWMEAANRRNRDKKITRLLEANFTARDLHMTLTYDYGFDQRDSMNRLDVIREYERAGLPFDDDDVRRDLHNYLRRLKRRIRARGGDPIKLKYLYVIESTYEPRIEEPEPLPPHYHIHIVIGGVAPLTREDLETVWGRGYANADRLDFSQNGLQALAKYLGKGKKFSQRWGHSVGLKQPEVRVTDRAISRRRAERVAADCQALKAESPEAAAWYREMAQAHIGFNSKGHEVIKKLIEAYKASDEYKRNPAFADGMLGAWNAIHDDLIAKTAEVKAMVDGFK